MSGEAPIDMLLGRLTGVKRVGVDWIALCPAHADTTPSLGIHEGDKSVVVTCRSHGCTVGDICSAVALRVSDLYYEPRQNNGNGNGNGNGHHAEPPAEVVTVGMLDDLRRYLASAASRLQSSEGAQARDELSRRFGLTATAAAHLGIGYDSGSSITDRPQFLGAWRGSPRIVVPMVDADGVARGCQGRTLRTASGNDGIGKRWLGAAGSGWDRVGCFALDQHGGPIIICEGLSDPLAVAAAGYSAIGVRGATLGAGAVTTIIGSLRGRSAIVVGDNDDAGRRFADALAAGLAGARLPVSLLRVPAAHSDVAEWAETLGAETFAEDLRSAVGAAEPVEAMSGADGQPEASAGLVRRELPPISEELASVIEIAGLRVRTGAQFLDATACEIRPIWGTATEILWAGGEPFLVVGPSGVGKSTLVQQVVKALLAGGDVLGFPVLPVEGRILLLAMDRAPQIARSMSRMWTLSDADEALLDRVRVWRGPLPFSIVRHPEALAWLADAQGCSIIVVDSLKDLAPNMSSEETGSQINMAFQIMCSAGIEVVGLHHQRKAQGDNKKPSTLGDVYGSQMLVNGAGSVILLWGEAGDPVVELTHLKQPAGQIGPLTVVHDHVTGTSTADVTPDAFSLVAGSPKGITAMAVAVAVAGTSSPTRNQTEKVRGRLRRLVESGRIRCDEGERGGGDHRQQTLYYPL